MEIHKYVYKNILPKPLNLEHEVMVIRYGIIRHHNAQYLHFHGNAN